MEDVIEAIKCVAVAFEPVGSRVTCNPAPTDTDIDYLVLAESGDVFAVLDDYKFLRGGSEITGADRTATDSRFVAYRSGDVNVIVTTSGVFFSRFMAATDVAKRLNLLEKADRIALFRAVLYAERAEVNKVEFA